ncbi:hypothetical protein [Sphaerisporangium rubeum]|uniref:Putative outer membrane lipoprotein n=1 Tax=Sphaerisporangium rubeum TaxID=321317 RepID=A0A7X0M9I2_9ACTN|nr:putative outer membrane lipoprotein [Sphaerisporangium rubeum]
MRLQRAQIWLFAVLSVVLLASGFGVITDLVLPSLPARRGSRCRW